MLGVFLDTETSGLDPGQDHPLEIAFQAVDLTTGVTIGSFESVINLSKEHWDKRNLTSIEINGFTWEEVSRGHKLSDVREQIIAAFTKWEVKRGGAVFICQNPSFDRGFFNRIVPVDKQEELVWPYHWLDLASMYWMKRVAQAASEGLPPPQLVALSKNEIARYFNLPPEDDPHRAMNGVKHLLLCYKALQASV